MTDTNISTALLERFTRYAAIGTQSNRDIADSGTLPSSESQKDFARQLVEEIQKIGLTDVDLDENFYILARIPATKGFDDGCCY